MKFTNEEIKQIVFVLCLGAGKLELAKRAKNARFGFIQSTKFEAYFSYLFSIFSFHNFCSANFRNYHASPYSNSRAADLVELFLRTVRRGRSYLDKRTGKTYTSRNFWTKSLPFFTEFYNQFYINKVKIVPNDLSLLTPLSLAHLNLIMNDGGKASSPPPSRTLVS